MKVLNRLLIFIFTVFCLIGCRVQLEPVQLFTFKEELEKSFLNAEVVKLTENAHFKKSFKITLQQPVDYNNDSLGTFKQTFFIGHIDEENPLIFISENLKLHTEINEFSVLLNSNQINIVNRFAVKSVPNRFKTVQFAAKDYHNIITGLRKLYTGKWISLGCKKGGLYTLNHRAVYPWDVQVTIVNNPIFDDLTEEVKDFLENRGKKIVYFNHKNQLNIKPHVDVLKLHSKNLNYLDGLNVNDYQKFIEKLKMWLGYGIQFYE